MNNPDASDGSHKLQRELLAIRQDTQVRRRALRLADGDVDRAEDGLQTAYVNVATVGHPERIRDLRAYFLRVLRNEILGQYVLPRPIAPEDLEDALDRGTAICGPIPSRPIDEMVDSAIRSQSMLKRLSDKRDRLLAAIPARSDAPLHYRGVIYEAAVQIVRDAGNGEVSDADSSEALRAAYVDYFAQAGASANLLHQRFRRAREDIRALLQAKIFRDELT